MCKKSKDCDEDSSRAKKAQRVGDGAIPIRSMRETARAVAMAVTSPCPNITSESRL